ALAAARGDAIFGKRRALPVAFLGDGEHQRSERFANVVAFELVEVLGLALIFFLNDREIRLHGFHRDDVIVFRQVHAIDARGIAPHRAHLRLAEQNGLTFTAGKEDHLLAVGEFCADQFVLRVQVNGDDAGGPRIREFGDGRLLHSAVLGGKEDVATFLLEIADGDHRGELFALLEANNAIDRFPARGRGGFGNFVDLQPIDAPLRGEEQDVAVRGGNEEVLDEIVFAGSRADAPLAAAGLMAVGFDRRALDVARVADGDGHFLVFDQVLELDFLDAIHDLGAALVAIGFHHVAQLPDDDRAELFIAGKDFFEFGDAFADLCEFFQNVVHRKLREAVQLQFENRVNLDVGEAENAFGRCGCAPGDGVFLGIELHAPHGGFLAAHEDANRLILEELVQVFASVGAAGGSADNFDHVINVVERDAVAE